ncbi:zinc-dependent peptidase [Lentisphaera profundi]|uniref:Zinc-dependent peptidase n=1 Tax=Lentisphaera profundi TaxID=1658616 RepID=A0ABY7VXP2_9BACT|nr:M90 family metallopeptidase [Lentisphaera profundi]WDE98048.1 zinc-dependent peptidase [Lentisphaera profundi]
MGVLFGITALALSLAIGIPLKKKLKRQSLMKKDVPNDWRTILSEEVPYLDKLSDPDREKLWGLIHIFLDEVEFISCQDLELTDRIRVAIAAQACLLTLKNPTQKHFDSLNTIYVYPDAFKSNIDQQQGSIVSSEESIRLGQSIRGSIVLSWNSCKQGASNYQDGQNVIFHEFAHQLDQEHNSADGVPTLQERSAYLDWGKIMYAKFLWLREKKKKHQHTLIDPYGALNEAEFFAVCTECFFEKPKQLKSKHPEIYRVMLEYYGLNPIELI